MRRLTFLILLILACACALVTPLQARLPVHHHRHHAAVHKATAPASQGVKVWVNTDSGVYHYAGERWYGATKEGEYMTEAAAKKAGYRPTENGQ